MSHSSVKDVKSNIELQPTAVDVKPQTAGDGDEHAHSIGWRDINRPFFVAAAAGAIWFVPAPPNIYFTALGVICTLVGGFPIFYEAYEDIVKRRMTMELSMTIAIVAALAIREIFTALVITLFVLVAEILESLTVGRGRRAIERLIELLPSNATVRRAGEWMDVEIREIAPGDVVLVRPGGRIPVDGAVAGGRSFVDQAPITGESMPVEKQPERMSSPARSISPAHSKYASSGSAATPLSAKSSKRWSARRLRERRFKELRIGWPATSFIWRWAAAAVTFFFSHNMRSTISVIIVAGACGIAAGTPLAILGAIGRAARNGVIIKGGLYLEKLAEADIVLLDKTGTLTYGTPEIEELRPAEGVSAEALLEAAAIAECQSEHPVAKAILSRASELKIILRHPELFEYTPGQGVVAEIDGEEITVGNWKQDRSAGRNAEKFSVGRF